jgi:hypothetical protein
MGECMVGWTSFGVMQSNFIVWVKVWFSKQKKMMN